MSRSNFMSRFGQVMATYADRLAAFHPNARLYLVSAVISGASMGVFRFLFNFYVLSLGYDQELLGNLVTATSFTALLMALPMGYVADFLGRKASLIGGASLSCVSVLMMVLFPSTPVFVAMNVVLGFAQSLAGVTMGPFLMENSGEKERTYLFSFASGFQTGSQFVGNWIGGYLPTWLGIAQGVSPTSTSAYGASLMVIAAGAGMAAVPMLFMRTPRLNKEQRSFFAPIAFFRQKPALLGKLILPMLVTSIGAGLIMPFMNIFFRQVHHQPDSVIGTLFAWGSLAMGLGLLVAPPLADRWGKIKFVVITQGLSIPFLVMLGFSPWFSLAAVAYYFRLALMNMNGPVYQTYVLEKVGPSARATVASLVSMANNFGWAFSPTLSGWIQVNYGFGPTYLGTIILYTVSIFLYWSFFLRRSPELKPEQNVTFLKVEHPIK
ncbi:MFS transporter [Longilinea arvoryzae]|uniref:MFS transporter n=1 Tax=Longilinea arvoryzae TaxID=360412 RepID=UPI00156120BB|nr:MFS transporter [Longilinea arvoryzae]